MPYQPKKLRNPPPLCVVVDVVVVIPVVAGGAAAAESNPSAMTPFDTRMNCCRSNVGHPHRANASDITAVTARSDLSLGSYDLLDAAGAESVILFMRHLPGGVLNKKRLLVDSVYSSICFFIIYIVNNLTADQPNLVVYLFLYCLHC